MMVSIFDLTPYLSSIVRYILAGVFLFASIQKINGPMVFAETVRSYKLLPQVVVRPFAFLLPWCEFILGALLILGLHTKIAAAATGLLYLLFTIALSINYFRGRSNLDCGCFGSKKKHRITIWLIFRDIGLLLASYLVAIFGGGGYAFDNLTRDTQIIVIYTLKEYFLPISLIVIGIILSYKLLNQALRLVYFSTKE